MKDETVKTVKLMDAVGWLGTKHGFVLEGEQAASAFDRRRKVLVKDGDRRLTFSRYDIHRAVEAVAVERWGGEFKCCEHRLIHDDYEVRMDNGPKPSAIDIAYRKMVDASAYMKELFFDDYGPRLPAFIATLILAPVLIVLVVALLVSGDGEPKGQYDCTSSANHAESLINDGWQLDEKRSMPGEFRCYKNPNYRAKHDD